LDIVLDPPVEGLFEFIEGALIHFDVCIYSARSGIGGIPTMRDWFVRHFDAWRTTERRLGHRHDDFMPVIRFPKCKPPATVFLDDRAITFVGIFPEISELLAFEPWTSNGEIIVGDDYDKHA
jgi:hypothetical protein